MSKGFVVVAQISEIDYIRQAYALALSIKASQPCINNVSLITNDPVPLEYLAVFDKIIPIPFKDHAKDSIWKVENRWKVYYASPYDETIVLDADMLILNNIESIWKFTEDRDLFFTSHVHDYKGRTIVDTTYRKTFVENDLPNLYTGMFYFKKSQLASDFFKVLEFITYNWEGIYYEITPKNSQPFFSMDVSAAIAAKIMGIEDIIVHTSSLFKFVHLKPALQGWSPVPQSALSQLMINFNDNKELFLNNFKQHGVFHYVEDAFLTDEIIKQLHV